MNIYDYTIVCAIFFYPFKTQGRIILGRTVWSCCLTQGMELANNDARKWPILPFDVSRDFIISNEILV